MTTVSKVPVTLGKERDDEHWANARKRLPDPRWRVDPAELYPERLWQIRDWPGQSGIREGGLARPT